MIAASLNQIVKTYAKITAKDSKRAGDILFQRSQDLEPGMGQVARPGSHDILAINSMTSFGHVCDEASSVENKQGRGDEYSSIDDHEEEKRQVQNQSFFRKLFRG